MAGSTNTTTLQVLNRCERGGSKQMPWAKAGKGQQCLKVPFPPPRGVQTAAERQQLQNSTTRKASLAALEMQHDCGGDRGPLTKNHPVGFLCSLTS